MEMSKNKKGCPFQGVVSLPLLSPDPYEMGEDLWAEIFRRLPIDNVCRLLSVCKWWNSILSSAFFIDLHLSFTPCNLKRRFLHVDKRFYHFRCDYDLTHEQYSLCTPLDIPSQHPIQQLHFPFRTDRSYGVNSFNCVDVIHGLVCISYSWYPSIEYLGPAFNSIFLWNPTIHKYVALPRLRLPRSNNAIGFGYDTSTKDFKVVVISWIPSVASQVYSHRRGSWRTTTDDSGIKLGSTWRSIARSGPVFVNGTIHWIVSTPISCVSNYTEPIGYCVLMFDCESEELRRMDIPKKLFRMEPLDIVLSEHDGMLSAFVVADPIIDRFDVWVMEERGVSASWNKLYTFSLINRDIFCDPWYEKLAPYGPNNPWYKNRGLDLRLSIISCDYVYDQNMLLMDHPKARSYANDEIVTISK